MVITYFTSELYISDLYPKWFWSAISKEGEFHDVAFNNLRVKCRSWISHSAIVSKIQWMKIEINQKWINEKRGIRKENGIAILYYSVSLVFSSLSR